MGFPRRFFKFVDFRTAIIILQSGTRRWSSPLNWDDQEEFRRMPQFEPSLRVAHRKLPRALVDVAFDRRKCDEDRLTPGTRFLVAAARALREHGLSEDSIVKLWDTEPVDSDAKLEAALRDFYSTDDLRTARVYCVTDELGNEHLWRHYADGGQGVALEFRHISRLDTPLVMAQPVRYSADGPCLDGALDFLLFEATRELKEELIRAVCLSKGLRYELECEWRVVTWAPEESGALYGDYTFHPTELASVIAGPQCNLGQLGTLRALLLARYPMTDLLRISASHDPSSLITLPVTMQVN